MTVSLRIIGYGVLAVRQLVNWGRVERKFAESEKGVNTNTYYQAGKFSSDTECKIGKGKCTIARATRRRFYLFVANTRCTVHIGHSVCNNSRFIQPKKTLVIVSCAWHIYITNNLGCVPEGSAGVVGRYS